MFTPLYEKKRGRVIGPPQKKVLYAMSNKMRKSEITLPKNYE